VLNSTFVLGLAQASLPQDVSLWCPITILATPWPSYYAHGSNARRSPQCRVTPGIGWGHLRWPPFLHTGCNWKSWIHTHDDVLPSWLGTMTPVFGFAFKTGIPPAPVSCDALHRFLLIRGRGRVPLNDIPMRGSATPPIGRDVPEVQTLWHRSTVRCLKRALE
jgi:hypothetical protein